MLLLRVLSVAALAVSAAWGQGTGGTNTTTTCSQGSFMYQGRCVTSCPAGMTVYPLPLSANSTCITAPSPSPLPSKSPAPSSYPSRTPAPSPSASASPAGPCDLQLPGGVPSTDGVCQCSPTDWIVRSQGALAPPFQKCAPVPPSMSPPFPPIACPSFVNGTVFMPEVADCVCRVPGPFVVLNQADRVLPYACSAVPDMTGTTTTCNTTAYFSVLQGICLSVPPAPSPSMDPLPSPSVPPAPSPSMDPLPSPSSVPPAPSKEACPTTWFIYNNQCLPFCPAVLYQGRCMDACPTGLYLLQGQCVDSCPLEFYVAQFNGTLACVPKGPGPMTCEQAVPGSHVDLTTGDCVCNKTDWMVRNRTAPVTEYRRMTTFCAPSLTGAPFNCPSFIDGTWFDPAVQMCQCRREVPFIVGNPADPALPFACVPSLTDPTLPVYRCNDTTFFDFRVEKCMPRPPQPLPSPDIVAPSRLPPAPSVSPALTSLPPPPEPSASPALPSRSALPSYAKTALPSVAPARRSAAPSRPPARSIAPTQRPATLQSTLNMPGARIPDNTTTAAATQTVQDIQSAIACSLRLPPEQVVIRNVTVTRPDGSLWNLPITILLSGNGTVLCYSLRTGAQRLLQSGGGDGSVTVDYTVVSPPDEVATLSATELTTTLAASAMMQEVMASTGAVSLVATTDSSLAAPSSQTPTTSTEESNKNLFLLAGGIGAGGAVLVLAVAAIAAVLLMKSQRRPALVEKKSVTPPTTVLMVVGPTETVTQMNPMTGASDRKAFEPTLRCGARV
jgi:hypothetical protein